MEQQVLRLRRVDVDLARRCVIHPDGTEVRLRPQLAVLLEKLAETRGTPVSESNLRRHVLGAKPGSVVKVAIHRLRAALDDHDHQDIQFGPGGYRLLPPPETGPGGTVGERLARSVRAAARLRGWSLEESPSGPTRAQVDGVALDLDPLFAWAGQVATHPEFTRLPALLGSDRGLPMESMFVSLSVCPAPPAADVEALGRRLSLADAVTHRRRRREARRIPVEELVDHPHHRLQVILGDPGSGKSSLLRRITLDVATGRSARWILPLPVNLPDWWASRRRAGSELDPIDFRLAGMFTGSPGRTSVVAHGRVWEEHAPRIRAMRSLLEAMSEGGGVLVLLDALDEIAADAEALRAATDAIRDTRGRFGCVVASRPAGFHGGIDEDERYELADLDDEGVDLLTRRWFSHQERPAEDTAADALLSQLAGESRLLEMGRNPFLLTLLCQLQLAAVSAGEVLTLPLYRSEVYERIVLLAARQAQARTRDATCLDLPVRDRLARFCAWLLSDARRAPRHLFSEDDWVGFGAPVPPFAQRVLPGRLVARWTEEGDYHLVHLTLHEYFASVSAVDRLDWLLERRFRPEWRVPLRFAGALLASARRTDDLRRLLRSLLDDPDVLGLTVIEAAWILLDAGVEDTRDLLGFDLRERLWAVWGEGQVIVSDNAGDALAVLAPRWLRARAYDVLDARAAMPPRAPATRTTLESWFDDGDDEGQAARCALVRLLARVRDPSVEDFLLKLGTNGPRDLANAAFDALHHTPTRRVREAVRRRTEHDVGDDLARRISRFAGATGEVAFLPWLERELRVGPEPRREAAAESLARIGTGACARVLLRWSADRKGADWELVAEALAGILDAGTAPEERDAVASWFQEGIARARGKERARRIGWAIRGGALPDSDVAAALSASDTQDIALEEVRDAADGGRVFGEAVVARLQTLGAGVDSFAALGKVVGARAQRRGTREDAAPFRAGLGHADPEVRAAAADTLGLLGDRDAGPPLLALALDPDEQVPVRVNALVALRSDISRGLPLDGLRRRVVDASEPDDVGTLAAEVLLERGMAEWGPVRDHPRARAALASWAGDRSILVFAWGWVDEQGNPHRWEE